MASPLLNDVVDGSFQKDVLQSAQPVLVDFWATYCGPCKALTPVLEDLAKTYQGKLKIVKFNVEGNIETPQRFGVTSLPRLIFFKGGAVVHTLAGVPSKAKIDEAIQKVLG
ncbi:MAG: thioredoxin [Deltaproteobacteria bacterium]|nr:thioredoxin [Deltaproteobacteria bacterium]